MNDAFKQNAALVQLAAQGFKATNPGVEIARSAASSHNNRIEHFNALGLIVGYSQSVNDQLVHHDARHRITGATQENSAGHPYIHRDAGLMPVATSKETGNGLEL